MTRQYLRMGYISRKSFVHRLSPLTKFIALICLAILTVTFISDFAAFTIFLFILLAYVGAGISPTFTVSRLRHILTFVFLIAIIQLLFTSYGTILFYLIPPLTIGVGPFFPITTSGIANAIVLALRLVNIVLASALFIATTDPTLFAASLTRLRIPYRYAFLLVLALRLVPLFDEETNIVQNAQRARGIPVDKGMVRGFFRRLRYTFLPLIFSALSRVDALTLAMDGRGFGYAKNRTYLRHPQFTPIDWIFTIAFLFVSTFLIWYFTMIAPLPHFLR